MKTFVIISDSHGRRGAIDRVKGLFAENDFVIHLGDGSSEMRPYSFEDPEKVRVCKGNCDFSYGEEEFVLEVEGVSILCCHGHRYGVKWGLEKLAARAKELDCEIALYGHTHKARVETVDGVLTVNPGAIGDYTEPSYAYLVIHQKKPTVTIVRL